ncbi:Ig-like domain-containing protein [Agromyces sp. MMS24-JH15]|uniref:Ig-like domain-containing protein n=1 Tax=Agromyces sp. MMS24-JH15 TaxID=3243765 RepID=UPI003747EED9
MARGTERRRPRRAIVAALTAGVAVVGVAAGFAITSAGYESQEVPRVEPTVWVTRDDGRYGRVNTDLAELDTVRSVDEPSAVAQAGASGVLFSGGLRERWTIDPASPVDLVDDAGDTTGGDAEPAAAGSGPIAVPTPGGTREVVSAGTHLAYRTDTGQLSIGELGADEVTTIDPFAAEESVEGEVDHVYAASAVAVDDRGRLAAFAASEGAVRRYDAESADFVGGPVALDDAPAADARVELAMVGGRWVLVEPGAGRAWVDGLESPVEIDVDADAVIQESGSQGDAAYLADGRGLVRLDLETGASERVLEASGVPAPPVVLADGPVAAWLGEASGTLWTPDGGERPLEVPDDVLRQASAITPVLRTNGDRAVLNETGSGLLWTAPDGRLIPLAEWSVDDDPEEEQGTVVSEDVPEEKPPVAVADTFGVRAGRLVSLPVLLNDHDPNLSDVLTIAAGSVTATADPGFGQVSVVAESQSLAIRVDATAGSTTFQYAVGDGAMTSEPVTVTLTVVPDDQNSAPEWCGVEECRQAWPSPQLLPGGTAITPVLDAWVDPDGDAFVLADAHAAEPDAPVSVVARADGRVAVRHSDPNAADASIPVVLTLVDANGAIAEKTLEVQVSASSSLQAEAVAVTGGAGENVAVDIADHVAGGSGSFRLVDAVDPLGGASGLVVTPNASAGTVELTAENPGEYSVTYTVIDTLTQSEESATIRLTVVDRTAPLAIAPITAFVRPGEDTRVDVLSAVQNSTGRVLLLSDASSSNGDLGVGIVGASQLRVAIPGGIAPVGGSALVGRAKVTVTDGTGAAVVGTVDVFLAEGGGDASPIALPDSVTVRAGELTDIDVLANDVSPHGARLVVGGDVVGAGVDGELAFASGDVVRYLAPTEVGTYRLAYSVALESDPSRTDHAAITVTVLPAGVNRPPRPPALSARVLSGQSVVIPVPVYGIDPDGDRVVLTGVGQPPVGSGTASIGAEGDTIVYRAPGGGVPGGQLSFEYTVRDGDGESEHATVRVGVLDAELVDAAPVTFSDYVRATRGSSGAVTVAPLGNDRDPAMGELELVDVVPNAPSGTAEYSRLEALVDPATDPGAGRVVLRPGDVAGTNSYLYTVRSTATSSTAQGLIVLNVSEQAATDHPTVTDTVVTARNRGEFEDTGLDVVTGHVEWATGDVGSLRLELWGARASGYHVDGWRISGALPARGDLVPFRLSTPDESVEVYGVLRIPAFDDLPVQLRADVDPIAVGEEKTQSFDVRKLLDLGPGDRVQFGDGPYTVQRQNSACRRTGSGEAEYQAGREAPWTDTCLVPVKLQGQARWSAVAVPVDIQPKDPQAQLTAISRTVAPGATESIALYDAMTSWEGGRVGDRARLDYQVAFGGSAFLLHGSGDQVSFEARADAIPGTRETATVSVSAFGGISATITLVVGVAPPDAPRGATLTKECTVTAGPCTIQVAGVGGEYDPFAGKTGSGLQLVSIGSGGAGVRCDVASVAVSGPTSVVATFPGGPVAFGGTCAVPFTVKDAQGRTGGGILTIDVLGYPQRPATVTTVGYSGDSVTLEVPLGDAAKAHPAVTGVRILRDGRDTGAACSPSLATVYRCIVSGLDNGAAVDLTARAVNAVGESQDTSPVTTWAYRQPEVAEVSARPVYEQGRTGVNNAVVELVIRSSGDTRDFRIVERNLTLHRQGEVSTYRIDVSPGLQLITVVPISQYRPPVDGTSDGRNAIAEVTAAGAPRFSRSIGAAASSNTSIAVSNAEVDANGSTLPGELVYIAWRNGSEPRCEVSASGGGLVVSGSNAITSASPTIAGLDDYEYYAVKACASNGYGVASSNTVSVVTYTSAPPPSGTATYTVATTATQSGSTWKYSLQAAPSLTPPSSKWTIQYYLYGGWTTSFGLRDDSAPVDVRVRACRQAIGQCTTDTVVTAATAPTTVTVDFPTACVVEATPDVVRVSGAAAGAATVEPTVAADGLTASMKVTFSGAYASLLPITQTIDVCPPPEEPEDPEEPIDPPVGTRTPPTTP